ncbi:MAG: DUF2461 domain-containing protein [Betaproteobacteria bacterium]
MHVTALVGFLDGLAHNNNRPWFAWNKPAYDILRAEFEELVADLAARVAKFDPALGPVDLKKAPFRIYRDTRFAKDKAPYKTQFSAAIGDRSKRGLAPGYYFHIDEAGVLMAGGGIYRPDPAILLRIRRHIAAHPELLTRLLRNPRFKRTYGGLTDEDRLARPPKGFAADTPHIEAIRNRHFFGIVEVDLLKHRPKDLATLIASHFRDLVPLMDWLRTAAAVKRR